MAPTEPPADFIPYAAVTITVYGPPIDPELDDEEDVIDSALGMAEDLRVAAEMMIGSALEDKWPPGVYHEVEERSYLDFEGGEH